MLTSRDRILTTHCGSLPRPPQLSELLLRQEAGECIDEQALHRESASAVAAVLDAQIKAGMDIVSDGEQPRVGFSMYLPLRMEGFGGEATRPTPRDLDDFPIFMERLRQNRGRRNRIANPPKAIGEVRYTGLLAAKAEYDLFKSALGALRQKPNETFMTAPSPGIIATTMVNEYYDSYETYVFALARELRKEYELIAAYGFLLQLDAPDFGLERARMFKNQSDAEFLHAMELYQSRDGRNSPRSNPAPRLLGQLGGPAHPRFPTLATPAPTLSSQGWCAEYRIRQSAAPARIPSAAKQPTTPGDDPDPGRDRHHHQLRRTPRGGGEPHMRGGANYRRSQPGDRRNRLWIWDLSRNRSGFVRRRLGEAGRLP
jgi:hypothetical protein